MMTCVQVVKPKSRIGVFACRRATFPADKAESRKSRSANTQVQALGEATPPR
jgi:hypothetical protein